jgi:hypothetical protein
MTEEERCPGIEKNKSKIYNILHKSTNNITGEIEMESGI